MQNGSELVALHEILYLKLLNLKRLNGCNLHLISFSNDFLDFQYLILCDATPWPFFKCRLDHSFNKEMQF